MVDGRKNQYVNKNLRMRSRFFWQSLKQIPILTLVIAIAGFIIGILDFTIVTFSPKNRIGISFAVVSGILFVIFLYFCINISKKKKLAKNLLINYLEEIIRQYKIKHEEYNLIERSIRVACDTNLKEKSNSISHSNEKWVFNRFDAISWLKKEIQSKNHVFIKGQMGIGKSMLLHSLASKLAESAIEEFKKNQLYNLIIPVLIPLKNTEYYNQEFLDDFTFIYHQDHKIKTTDYIAWLSHILTIDSNANKKDEKIFYDYLRFTFSKNIQKYFALIFDAFDEFPYKQYEGNLAPKKLFWGSYRESDNLWKGPLVISSRPLILDDLENRIYNFKSRIFKQYETRVNHDYTYIWTYQFCSIPHFSDTEIKRFLENRVIYNKEEFKSWKDFEEEIILKQWSINFGVDWRIPLFLWALSEEVHEKMPKTRMELYETVFRRSFNWFYCKKDMFVKSNQDYNWRNYNIDTNKRTIIINNENLNESTFTFSPASYFFWEKEIHKKIAFYLNKETKQGFTKKDFEIILKKQKFTHITTDEQNKFHRILEQVIDDGNYIICPTFDEQNLPIYSYSPFRLQEAFTAMNFIGISKSKQIHFLATILLNIQNMIDVLILCWKLHNEKSGNDEYFKKLLIAACPDFKFLFQIDEFVPFKHLTRINEINKIDNVVRFSYLDLEGLNLKDISSLNHMDQLKNLSLNNNKIENITPISKLIRLEYLDISENRIKDINCLRDLKKLQYLLINNNTLDDISSLKFLTQLVRLELMANKIIDVSSLSKLIHLQRLDLPYNNIKDISPLSNLTQLKGLDLGSNRITDISPIRNFSQLHFAYLAHNKIKDITPIEKLTQLKDLYLLKNKISDISVLSSLKKLRLADLDNNDIKSISSLANLINLEYLCLSNNQITDFSYLNNLSNLRKLSLRGNNISSLDVSYLVQFKNLVSFYIDDDVQLICKKRLLDNIKSPVLEKMKKRIKPIE